MCLFTYSTNVFYEFVVLTTYIISFQVILSAQNVLILNLCIADLMLIIFNMPLTLMELNKIYWENSFKGLV